MEELLLKIAMNGGPSAIITLGGLLWFNRRINDIQSDVKELKHGKRWTETCDAKHVEVDRRLNRIEDKFKGELI